MIFMLELDNNMEVYSYDDEAVYSNYFGLLMALFGKFLFLNIIASERKKFIWNIYALKSLQFPVSRQELLSEYGRFPFLPFVVSWS